MNRAEFVADMVILVRQLIPTIADNYRSASQERDDTEPQMDLTVGANQNGWSYQTGDNSFTGGAYGFADWATTTLTRTSDPVEVAEEIASQLDDPVGDDVFTEEE